MNKSVEKIRTQQLLLSAATNVYTISSLVGEAGQVSGHEYSLRTGVYLFRSSFQSELLLLGLNRPILSFLSKHERDFVRNFVPLKLKNECSFDFMLSVLLPSMIP